MEYDFDLISIGSGSAGRRVAVALSKAGWKVGIVEKDVKGHFGGTCISSGCIPTKALIEKTQYTNDFSLALEHKKKIVERIRNGTLRHVKERSGIDVIEGFGRFIDNHTIEVNGILYTSKHFVIATGSRSLIPPIYGLENVNYVTSKELLKLTYIPKRILIVGGGRIGLEFAQLFYSQGSEITIFEGLPQILSGEDREMVTLITDFLVKKGISIIRDKFVDEVKEEKGEISVILNSGKHKGVYKGDVLLIATGRIPNTEGLGLEKTDVKLKRATIKVNEFMQTSVDHIFAIGDVIGNPMFTNWASYMSGLLLSNLKKSETKTEAWKPLTKPNIPRICFIQPEFAAVGLTEEEAREQYGDNIVVYKFKNKWLGKSMIVDDWDGILKGIGKKDSNEILGVHFWGQKTGSLIQTIVLAMENGLGWSHLASMVYGHPVLAEGIYSLAYGMIELTK